MGVRGLVAVSAPTIPKVRGSNPSWGTVGIVASPPVRVWILCVTKRLKTDDTSF